MILTKIEVIAFCILAAYVIVGGFWAVSSLVRYIRFGWREKKKIKALNISPTDLVGILAWSERDNEELREELESNGYPKGLIKKAFDKSDVGALDRLIEIADKRVRENKKVGELKKNKCQWKLPVEYKESSGVVVVGRRESKAKREEK